MGGLAFDVLHFSLGSSSWDSEQDAPEDVRQTDNVGPRKLPKMTDEISGAQ
jgi:hypothetical protein